MFECNWVKQKTQAKFITVPINGILTCLVNGLIQVYTLNCKITELESSASSLTESVGVKDGTLREIYAAKAETEAELAEVNGEVTILQSRVTSLNQQIQRLETELDAADDPEVYIARDCYELYRLHGVREDGVYDIYPFGANGKSVKAFCYMGDGGGWTVRCRLG